VFRGQSSAGWKLKSSLDRTRKSFKITGDQIWNLEEWYLDEFKRYYRIYAPESTPEDEDTIYWLSLIRHYFAPSRLMDFTFSFFIAAYFALEDAKGKCAIWAVNKTWLNGPNGKLMREIGGKALEEAWQDREGWAFDMVMLRNKREKKRKRHQRMVFPVNPLQMHQRLAAQQGLFLCPTDIAATFDKNLLAMDGSDKKQNVVKIIIKGGDSRNSILFNLHRTGINEAVLFPGLDGFARGLGPRTPLFLKLHRMIAMDSRPPTRAGLV
jgi:hypothetical protein